MSIKSKIQKAIAYTGLAAAAMSAGGCRTFYQPASERDKAHFEVFEKANVGNMGSLPAERSVPKALRNLEFLADGKQEESFNIGEYEKPLKNDYAILRDVRELNLTAERAQKGFDAFVLELNSYLNGLTPDVIKAMNSKPSEEQTRFIDLLQDKHKKGLEDAQKAAYDFATFFGNHKDFGFRTLAQLRTSAYATRDLKLMRKVDEEIERLRTNCERMKTGEIVRLALRGSEGMYGEEYLRGVGMLDNMEKLKTGVGFLELGENVAKKYVGDKVLDEQMKDIAGHFAHDGAGDLDDIVRDNRYTLVKEAWKAYLDKKISGKELNAAVAYIDSRIAGASRDTPRRSSGAKLITNLGNSVIPLVPLINTVSAGSYWVAPNRISDSMDEKDATLERIVYESLYGKYGLSNLPNVPGDGAEAGWEVLIGLIQTAGQASAVAGAVSGGGHHGGGGAAPRPADAPPAPSPAGPGFHPGAQ